MRLPNFLIIGAHKAGTTSLSAYLKSHPQIFMSELKEARFFAFNRENPEHLNKSRKIFPIRTLEEYQKLFDPVKDEIAFGEASPEYLNSEYAANNIFKHIPEAKLVVSLRNPIDRAYSTFLMRHRSGDIKNININNYKLTEEAAKKGFYYPKLKIYFDIFKREQIKIILFEDMVADTSNTVKEIFKYLEVDAKFTPDCSVVYNRGGAPKSKTLYKISKNKKLKKILKTYLSDNIVKKLGDIKRSSIRNAPKLTDAQRIESMKLVKEDILRLEDLLRLDLSVWYEI